MLNVRLAGDRLYGKLLFTRLSLELSLMVSFCSFLFPLYVLDELSYLHESVSEGFLPTFPLEMEVEKRLKNVTFPQY